MVWRSSPAAENFLENQERFRVCHSRRSMGRRLHEPDVRSVLVRDPELDVSEVRQSIILSIER
jgi:hypothetical protein